MPDDREDINLAERSLELDSIELAAAIFGSGDQNIHLLERSSASRRSAAARCCALRGSSVMWTPLPALWTAW